MFMEVIQCMHVISTLYAYSIAVYKCIIIFIDLFPFLEWFHSPAHCLQEEPHQGGRIASQIRSLH